MGFQEEVQKKAKLEKFEVELRLDCTVKVGDWDFVKPGVAGKLHFDTIPQEGQLKEAMSFLNQHVLEPTLEDVITEVQQKLKKAR